MSDSLPRRDISRSKRGEVRVDALDTDDARLDATNETSAWSLGPILAHVGELDRAADGFLLDDRQRVRKPGVAGIWNISSATGQIASVRIREWLQGVLERRRRRRRHCRACPGNRLCSQPPPAVPQSREATDQSAGGLAPQINDAGDVGGDRDRGRHFAVGIAFPACRRSGCGSIHLFNSNGTGRLHGQ